MKLTIPQLKAQLKGERQNGVYLFYGEEKYILNSYTEQIKNNCVTDFPEFNYLEMNEENADFETFVAFFQSYPQLSDKKMAVIKNSGLLQDSRYQKKFAELFCASPDYIVVVFIEDSIAKIKKDIIASIEKNGFVTEFVKQNPSDLRAWVNKKFAMSGKRMRIEHMEYLVNLCNRSLEKLSIECDKLISGCHDEIITDEHINALVTVPTEYKIFAMADCLLNKQADEAYNLLKEFKINKEQPTEIIALIYASVSEIFMFKTLMNQGVSGEMFLAPNRKWLAGKYKAQAAKQDYVKLRKIMKLCYFYDERIKTGAIEPYTALEVIIASML